MEGGITLLDTDVLTFGNRRMCVPERNSQHTRMFFGSAVCNIKMKQIGNRSNAQQMCKELSTCINLRTRLYEKPVAQGYVQGNKTFIK